MKYNSTNTTIEMLEKEIQYLHQDYKRLLNQQNSFNDLKAIRMQIKQAEESLRLKKRIQYVTLN